MDVKTSTDIQLIDALRSQSIEALEELYDRYNRVAMAVAYRVLGDRNLAEDVLQEAFLAVWRQAVSGRDGTGLDRLVSVEPYLGREVVSVARSGLWLNRHGNRHMADYREVAHKPADTTQSSG